MAGIESEDWVMGLTCIAEESGNLYMSTHGFRVLRIPKGYRLKIGEGLDSATVEEWHEPWNGEGLPPVGTTCEWRPSIDQLIVVTILGRDGDETWFRRKGNQFSETCVNMAFFRPIRTPEQIAAEERKEAIDKLVQFFMNYYGNPKGAEQYLLICRSLHDAGYRKQEQP